MRDFSALNDWHFEISDTVRKLVTNLPDAAKPERVSAINLEDFPAGVVKLLAAQVPGLAVRRAARM